MKMQAYFACLLLTAIACSEKPSEAKKTKQFTNGATTQFTKVAPDVSSVSFTNKIIQTLEFNYTQYEYIYTGSGVAVLDFDGDGFQDLYFVSNFGPNKLYKNNGDFKFEDVTKASKTEDFQGFSTGVSILDVNTDGWPDIYVCKAGSPKSNELRENLLFVNQKDGTFKESAKQWGLNFPGFSTQAYPIDYDRDGDKDLYLVNHRYDFKNAATISGEIQSKIENITSDQLFRNDGNSFANVTEELGLYNKTWGLSAVVSDFNNDGWEDIYVANDFSEPDVLYINQKNGSFRNQINDRLKHISFNSMGSDFADLNNDLSPDLLTVDMLSDNYARSKENMASMDTETFRRMVSIGYHHAYMANMLHMNTGDGFFNEIGQFSGVTKTDWSWAPLIADFDNDGLKDIYVTNGVDREYNNQDTRKKLRALSAANKSIAIDELLNLFPSERLLNHAYKNNGDLSFEKSMEHWGLTDKTYSYGAAYADLDNDGDLDIITNNLNDPASIYRNNSAANYISIKLKGPVKNPMAIGAKVYIKNDQKEQVKELYLARGYESSVTSILSFGLGNSATESQVQVVWPDGKTSLLNDVKPNQEVVISYVEASNNPVNIGKIAFQKQRVDAAELGITYKHLENDFDDFAVQLLLPQKESSKGTGIVTGDVNGDGLDDFFVGNALGAAAALYIQDTSGKFKNTNESLWKTEAKYEDANALFFDAEGDGDLDLYVVSAGYELSENDTLLQDRLYLNDGKGNFSKNNKALPKMLTSGKAIAAADYDNDGDLDLFVGGNVIPGKYPLAPRSYLLKNKGGIFTDVTSENADLTSPGMISEVLFSDYDNDNDLDILAVGEWMNPTIFSNHKGHFTKESIPSLEKNEGWWFSATQGDFDGDGDMDYVFGNMGKNNKFQPKEEKPLFIYAKDFDENGSFDVALSKINEGKRVPVRGKQCSSEQNPFLLEKIETYKEFASLDMNAIYGEDKLNDAYQLVAHHFETMYAQNNGDGTFKLSKLVNEAQLGPTLSIIAKDFNNDGFMDIMGIGAIYDAEVETIRYDSNFGYVLLGDGKGEFTYAKEYDPFVVSDAKDITQITVQGQPYFMTVSNNAAIEVFTFKQ